MYQYELAKASQKLVRDMFKLKKDEIFIITADTESDMKVVEAVAAGAYAAGAKPMVITIPSPAGVGKDADRDIPLKSLEAALCKADAWVEFNNKWLLYSTPFLTAMRENPRLRYLCLVGMNDSMMVRTIGRVNQPALSLFQSEIASLTEKADRVRLKTEAGCDITFAINHEYRVFCDDGNCSEPGIYMLGGQISVFPKFGSVQGTLVFDGSVTPPCGLLSEPVRLEIKDHRVVDISGGKQAAELKKWLESFDDDKMFNVAHMSYGFNPGALLTGNVLEDERVWGCVEWGLGFVNATSAPPGNDAKSHTDGICLNATIWLDDIMLMDRGVICDERLRGLKDSLLNG